jgi:hypothetical protein
MADGRLTRMDFEGIDRGLIEILLLHFPGGTEGNHEHPLRRAVLRMRSALSNASPKINRCINILCVVMIR